VESCDVYFYKVGRKLGIDRIHDYGLRCGLGLKTGIDLANEKPGLIPSREWKKEKFGSPWQQGETVTVAIGQSYVLVTPLQLANMISAVFNGGNIYKPRVVRWADKGEKRSTTFAPTLIGKLGFSEENLHLVKQALTGAVNESRGTGTRARQPEVLAAGKTGTAQVIALEAEKELGEDEEIPIRFRDHAWFVAIAPVDRPKLALAILIENGGHGGSAAAPIAGEMFKFFFRKEQDRIHSQDESKGS
jgi:penicillin-binding protein 2